MKPIRLGLLTRSSNTALEPLYDTTATAVWQCLRIAGADAARVQGWGRLFRENPCALT